VSPANVPRKEVGKTDIVVDLGGADGGLSIDLHEGKKKDGVFPCVCLWPFRQGGGGRGKKWPLHRDGQRGWSFVQARKLPLFHREEFRHGL